MKGIPCDKDLYKNTKKWIPIPESVHVFKFELLQRTGQGVYVQAPLPLFLFFLIYKTE